MAPADNFPHGSRREFLRNGAALAGLALAPPLTAVRGLAAAPAAPAKLRVGAVVTEFTYRSHAHVILENFLERYYFNGQPTDSGCEVVGLYVDQFPEREMGREVAAAYGIPIFPTIEGALTLGGRTLAVDAVLSIAEHGKYPVNSKAQQEYPRKRFFDGIVATFEKTGAVAPVFSDKHLSYRSDWATEMVETSKRMGFALMAGSSVPLAQRRPPLELPPEAPMTSAVSIHGGGVESYDIHALEVLQSMVEGRKGGEPGVASVQFLEGDPLWKAAEAGLWEPALADAAMAAELGPGLPPVREIVGHPGVGDQPIHGILVTYKDGFRAIMLRVGSSAMRWNFACRLEGEDQPLATSFYVGPWQNRNLFRALSHAIQVHFREKRAPYPVERTLLTTCVLDQAMTSRIEGGRVVESPYLSVAYQPRDFRAMREMGASWKIITEEVPEPEGIDIRLRGA